MTANALSRLRLRGAADRARFPLTARVLARRDFRMASGLDFASLQVGAARGFGEVVRFLEPVGDGASISSRWRI